MKKKKGFFLVTKRSEGEEESEDEYTMADVVREFSPGGDGRANELETDSEEDDDKSSRNDSDSDNEQETTHLTTEMLSEDDDDVTIASLCSSVRTNSDTPDKQPENTCSCTSKCLTKKCPCRLAGKACTPQCGARTKHGELIHGKCENDEDRTASKVEDGKQKQKQKGKEKKKKKTEASTPKQAAWNYDKGNWSSFKPSIISKIVCFGLCGSAGYAGLSIIAIFFLFFPLYLVDLAVYESNRYRLFKEKILARYHADNFDTMGKRRRRYFFRVLKTAKQDAQSLPFTREEFFTFIGLCLVTGTVPFHSKSFYWRSVWPWRAPFKGYMTRERFDQWLRNLHFNCPKATEDEGGVSVGDCLWKIKPLIVVLSLTFSWYYWPFLCVTIDESMIKWHGWLYFKQYLPSKPIKFGIKVWLAACSHLSYVFSFQIYTGKGKDPYAHIPQLLEGESKRQAQKRRKAAKAEVDASDELVGTRVVMDLVSRLRVPGYTVITDNFFTSIQLLEELFGLGHCGVGTVRAGRKDLPFKLWQLPTPLDKFEAVFATLFWGGLYMLCVVWNDKKNVAVLSTANTCNVTKGIRRPDKKSAPEECDMPEALRDYNRWYSGVDVVDQALAAYNMDMGTSKYCIRMFFYFLGLAVNNAVIIYRLSNWEWKTDTLVIKHFLALSLLSLGGKGYCYSGKRPGRPASRALAKRFSPPGKQPTVYDKPASVPGHIRHIIFCVTTIDFFGNRQKLPPPYECCDVEREMARVKAVPFWDSLSSRTEYVEKELAQHREEKNKMSLSFLTGVKKKKTKQSAPLYPDPETVNVDIEKLFTSLPELYSQWQTTVNNHDEYPAPEYDSFGEHLICPCFEQPCRETPVVTWSPEKVVPALVIPSGVWKLNYTPQIEHVVSTGLDLIVFFHHKKSDSLQLSVIFERYGTDQALLPFLQLLLNLPDSPFDIVGKCLTYNKEIACPFLREGFKSYSPSVNHGKDKAALHHPSSAVDNRNLKRARSIEIDDVVEVVNVVEVEDNPLELGSSQLSTECAPVTPVKTPTAESVEVAPKDIQSNIQISPDSAPTTPANIIPTVSTPDSGYHDLLAVGDKSVEPEENSNLQISPDSTPTPTNIVPTTVSTPDSGYHDLLAVREIMTPNSKSVPRKQRPPFAKKQLTGSGFENRFTDRHFPAVGGVSEQRPCAQCGGRNRSMPICEECNCFLHLECNRVFHTLGVGRTIW
eukprot:Lithocolla_globosa_v1_NODE_123_length_6073_cov_7.341808.p1 type:complete len:1211 gc:universal NODE_123_length_6073_cov_7.341808:4342-710(-)